MNMRLFFSLKYSSLILFSCFRIPLISSEAQNSAAVWRKNSGQTTFWHVKNRIHTSSEVWANEIKSSCFESISVTFQQVFEIQNVFFMKSVRQSSLKYENQSFPQNILSEFCTRCCPFIYVAIMCTGFVEIIGVIENVYLVLTVILLKGSEYLHSREKL